MSIHNEMANSASPAAASPLRRSARLNRDVGIGSGLRSQPEAMDASAWSSSLYSTRDPSQVSSYYLRPYEEEKKDASMDDSLTGLGSLLRGAQRPTHTPRSYVRDRSAFPDYSEEDKFMERVESEWRQRSGHEDDPPSGTPELEQADDPVFETQPTTPQVPGLFRSVLHSAKRAASPASPARRPIVWPTLLWCAIAVLIAYVWYAHFPTFLSASDPLVTSRPWTSPASGSSQELRERIVTLEGALNKVWRSVGDLSQELRTSQDKVLQRLSTLEQKSVLRSSFDALEHDVRALKKQHAESVSHWQAEKARIEALLSQSKDTNSAAFRARLADLDTRLTRAEVQAREASEAAKQAKQAWEPLRGFLPERMPVRYDARTQQVRIDPAFWHEFRKVVPAQHQGTAPMSWEAFLAEHRHELDAWIADLLHHSRDDNAVMLDRSTFFKLMEAEITRAKTELSTQFNEHVHGLESDVLAKVQYRLEQQQKQEGASSSVVHVGDVRAMIDAALAVYAADQIGRADFAQYSAGARVIPSLTSPTHEVRVQGANVHSLSSMLAHMLPLPVLWRHRSASDSYTVRGRMPVVALHHDTSPGMCWPFSGSHGQLGIQLVRRVRVQAVTLDHVPSNLSLDGQGSAPRDVEVWGLLESPHDRVQTVPDDPTPVPPSPLHVFLGSFTYDAQPGAPPIQTFPVRDVGVAFRVIQLSVLSNHGLRDFTCLYRVRVHGDPVSL